MRVLADGRLWYNMRGQGHSASVFWSLDADRRLVLDKCDSVRLLVCPSSYEYFVGQKGCRYIDYLGQAPQSINLFAAIASLWLNVPFCCLNFHPVVQAVAHCVMMTLVSNLDLVAAAMLQP
jgi:hypothetical protein